MFYSIALPSSDPRGGCGTSVTVQADTPEAAILASVKDREFAKCINGCGYSVPFSEIHGLRFVPQVTETSTSNQPDHYEVFGKCYLRGGTELTVHVGVPKQLEDVTEA